LGPDFCILDCRFTPVAALGIDTASLQQFEKLKTQIAACRLSLHDLSRATAPRFNMPLELDRFQEKWSPVFRPKAV
jgi:hypothetical protein